MHLPQRLPVVLVHGGFYDDMTTTEFWTDTGVSAALNAGGTTFIAPQRPTNPVSWAEETTALLTAIDDASFDSVLLVGGSHGCAVAARFAVDYPDRVARLLLAWPATAGDQVTDGLARVVIEDVHGTEAADALLEGETLWGVSDAELGALEMPLVIFPSMPANHTHQRETTTRLLQARPDGFVATGGPEPLDKQFDEFRDGFVQIVTTVAQVEHDD